MEGKVLLQDLALSLAAKRNAQRKDVEAFMKAFFETIREGILQDKIVFFLLVSLYNYYT